MINNLQADSPTTEHFKIPYSDYGFAAAGGLNSGLIYTEKNLNALDQNASITKMNKTFF